MTEIKPSYIKAFCKTFVMFFFLGSIFFPSVAYFQGDPYSIEQAIGIGIISGLFLGFFGTLVFTPRKIKWNELMRLLADGFPQKKRTIWLGPIPIK